MTSTTAMKKGWTRVAFGDVVRQVKDSIDIEKSGLDRYVAGEHMDSDDLRIRRWGIVSNDYLGPAFHIRFRPGQVLYGSRRTYLRKVAVADFEGICANTTFVLETRDPEVLLSELLPYIMQTESFHEHSIEQSKGSVNPYVNFSDLLWYDFALPPLEEQRRILDALQAAETNVNALRNLNQSLRVMRNSSIDSLTFSLNAEMSSVGEHCTMQNGRPFPGKEYCDDGELLLRPGNLSPSGYLSWDSHKTTHVPARYRDEAREFIVKPGDVMINLTAQSLEDGFMGRACIAREGDESLLNQRIGRFTDFSERLLPEFLFRVLQSTNFRRHAIGMCEGSKVKHLFWQHIARFQIPLPAVEEQSRVVDDLRSIDAGVDDARGRLHAACQLKRRLVASLLDNHVRHEE